MKSIVIDSSSVILLQKAALLDLVLLHYSVSIAESVYRELTRVDKVGASQLRDLFGNRVKQAERWGSWKCKMGQGERDTIELYRQGVYDFIVIDDKKAAQYCKSHQIPFINSLLITRIFSMTGVLDEDQADDKFEELVEWGYYSAAIVRGADSLNIDSLKQFFP